MDKKGSLVFDYKNLELVFVSESERRDQKSHGLPMKQDAALFERRLE